MNLPIYLIQILDSKFVSKNPSNYSAARTEKPAGKSGAHDPVFNVILKSIPKKLILTRQNKLIMIQHNKLINAHHKKLI